MRRSRGGFGRIFGRVTAGALALGLLMLAVGVTTAYGITNTPATLDIGAGESLTLDGVNTYTSSINIHDGGVLWVGGSGTLTLKSPSITVRSAGVIQGTGRGAGGAGASIAVECTTLTVNDGTIAATGNDGASSWPWDGKPGGSIVVTATREVAIPGGGLFANGGGGYLLAGNGGPGGAIRVHSPRITINLAGTLVANGGNPWAGTGYDGGDGGALSLTSGRYTQFSGMSAKGGNGSSLDGPFSIGGDGGGGGSVALTADREVPPAGTIDISGGLAGYGDEADGTPGATGTVMHVTETDAPYDASVPCDGVVPAGSPTEYQLSWYWDPTFDTVSEVYLHQDGHNLYVGMRHGGVTSGYVWLLVDVNNDGGAAPNTGDRAFLVGTGLNRGQFDEYAGNGASWVHTGPTGGWTGTSSLQTTTDHLEWQISLAKLGITPGVPKTLGVAFAFLPSPSGTICPWPPSATYLQPGTWPDLASSVNWTARGNTGPGGWSGFAPTLTNDATPDCSAQVFDSDNGLDVSTAQYRYSTNGGSTWSAYATAACTGSDGTTALQTVSKTALPFPASMTANKIQFRVADMGGVYGESPQYTVAVDASGPAPWTEFAPATTVTATLEPDCTAKTADALSGLRVTTAEYQYSRDGGGTWTAWLPAACTGANSTTATQTVSAHAVPFNQDSSTLNKVRFRVTDMAGNISTSGTFNVVISVGIYDLPLNGDFEFGAVGALPTFWSAYSYRTTIGAATETSACQIVAAQRFHGAQSVWGKMSVFDTGAPATANHLTKMHVVSPINLSGTRYIDLAMRDIATTASGPLISWDCGIGLMFEDGVSPEQIVYLYRNTSTSGVTDTRTGTATGTDGDTWSLYRAAVPAGLDLRNVTLSVVWRAYGANNALGATVAAESKVDWVRVVDETPPASSASVSGASWSETDVRDVSFLATDYVGLSAVQLWKRNDTGSGFGSWTRDQSRSVVGTLTSGAFSVSTPAEGRYEFYTRAVDTSGNVEAAPGSADAWCGIDHSAPTFGNLVPPGWVNDLSPVVTIDVRDVGSGLGLTPSAIGSLPDLYKATDCVEYGTTVYSNQYNWLSVVDASIPGAPVDSGGIDLPADITDLETEVGRPWLYAALGNAGVVALDVSTPLSPELVGGIDGLGMVRFIATGAVSFKGAPLPLLFASDGRFVHIIDASKPVEGLALIRTFDVGNVTDIAFADGLLYVAQSGGLLWVYDVSSPEEPIAFDSGPQLSAEFTVLAVRDGRLYVADSDGFLWIWDTHTIPDTWVPFTEEPVPGLFPGIPTALRIAGDRLFIATDSPDVEVIDVSVSTAPSSLHTLASDGGKTLTVAPLGRYAVTFNEIAGMLVWGFPEPAYRFSSDAGGTWSDWLEPTASIAEGTSTTQTLTATRAVFAGDSDTNNVVEFAVGDMLTRYGTSGGRPVRVDTTVPRVMGPMSTTHSNPASWYPATTVNVSWGAYADLSGITGYAHGWDDVPTTALPSSVTTTAMMTTRTGVPEGVHFLHVRPVDAAGNWGDTSHLAYRVDFTAPTAPTGVTASPTASTTDSFTVSWTNPAQTYAPLDAAYYKLDALPVSPTDGTRVPGATSSMSGIHGLSEGTHTVYVWLRDAAGNVNHASRSSTTFVYDSSAPAAPTVTSSTHPVEGTWYATSPVQLSWLAAEAGSSIDGYSWGLDDSATAEPDYVSDGTTTTASYGLSDGVRYFHVRARNTMGMWSTVRTFAIRRDSTAPAGSVAVNAGSAATNSTAVTVNCSMTDISPMTMRYSLDGGDTWSGSVSYAATQAVTLPGTDGTKTVTMRFTDAAGNVTDRSDAIVLDTTQPTGTISANDGAVYTTLLSVTLTNAVADATPLEMRFSGNGGSTWSAWEAYAVTKGGIAVPAGDGGKTLLGEFRDAAGNIRQLSDTITVDQTGPAMGAITSESHAVETSWYANRNPMLAWSATDAVSGVSGYTWTLDASAATAAPMTGESDTTTTSCSTPADGVWYFHARARDGAGNWGVTTHRVVRIDATAPRGTLSLDAGAAATEDVVVSADSSVSDISPMQMRFSMNGGSVWTSWEAYAQHRAITIPNVEGNATVLAQYRDSAGTVLNLSDTITVDLTAESTRIYGSDRYTTAIAVSRSTFATGACNAVVIATGLNYPDALSAAGVAGAVRCPILLVQGDVLTSAVKNEIKRVVSGHASYKVYIIGSAAAVTAKMEASIKASLTGETVKRLQGTNRYLTAQAVAREVKLVLGASTSTRAFLVTGLDFPDGLLCGPASYRAHAPILLVGTAIDSNLTNTLKALGTTQVVVVGSTANVPAAVESALKAAIPGLTTVRVANNTDRYTRSTLAATYMTANFGLSWSEVGIATGEKYPDALGAGCLEGERGTVLLLTKTLSLPTSVSSALTLHESEIGAVRFYGSTAAVSASVATAVMTIVN